MTHRITKSMINLYVINARHNFAKAVMVYHDPRACIFCSGINPGGPYGCAIIVNPDSPDLRRRGVRANQCRYPGSVVQWRTARYEQSWTKKRAVRFFITIHGIDYRGPLAAIDRCVGNHCHHNYNKWRSAIAEAGTPYTPATSRPAFIRLIY